eukprot:CAMPEP_0117426170 /NCGR_PEP_ID=MMETSP0758-20121206/6328_1 /TAXON_ID=63605 /ORGANISM="Percolomonas cosmopolitus, Strain AE-1 (ATCC 50343)" /LENGTH=723 /DNA_ID=CAMNT_0005211159 /DNA_START=55 /DNA_END=2223 /DNA_ORIENTATION=+
MNPTNDVYSFEEDAFLLYLKQKLKKITVKELHKRYKNQSKHDEYNFPKSDVTGEELKSRLDTLDKEGGLRYQILISKALKKLQGDQPSEDMDVTPATPGGDKEQKEDCISLLDESARKDALAGESMVEITLTGRSFSPTNLKIRESYLKNNSVFLKDVLKKTSAVKNMKQIGFSEFDDKFKGHEFGAAFHPDTFSRFLLYCQNNDIQEKYFAIQDRWDAFNKESEKSLNEAVKKLQEDCESRIRSMQNVIEKEKSQLTRIFDHCLEKDLKQIRLLYKSQLFAHTQTMQSVFDSKKHDIESFYTSEIGKMKEIYYANQAIRRVALEKEKINIENMLQKALPESSLVSLLILSDVLKIDELRVICLNRLSKNFQAFRTSPVLGSSLLLESTLTELMDQLTDDTLLSLYDDVDYSFPRALVEKELKYRQSIHLEKYRQMTTNELIHELDHGQPVFPAILESELSHRRDKVPYVTMELPEPSQLAKTPKTPTATPSMFKSVVSPSAGAHKFPRTMVDADCLTIRQMHHKKYQSIYASHSRISDGWGKWYFEVEILKFDNQYGSSLSIGWGVPYLTLDSKIIGVSPNDRHQSGFSIHSDGLFYCNGQRFVLDETLKEGDIIGVSLNQDIKSKSFQPSSSVMSSMMDSENATSEHTTSFFINGEAIQIKNEHDIQVVDAQYNLYPACSIYNGIPDSAIVVRFNFAGPFKYTPPRLHAAYGDELKSSRYD